ncbi:DNA polymerase III subunit gamma/tau [Thermotoga profunda]|uniref:DNA polymerase III subunit gamma/tau n=1 Tax=Thermotoga profunda TaxID=1508420 RepID=UPI000597E8E8|nr:DNA polymerase III subunit gamma/tau [Thermotoga profunda]
MEALYRKYRPKNFDQIIDQLQAKLVLQNAIVKDKVSHAYIFTGPRGTGKTSVARVLAKALNCDNRVNYEPCCQCENCISIDKGIHPDVIELDAASNRGIDEIRRIRDAVGFRPMLGKYKIYIVDEFHMLTREAFNALLKTLEEPPEKVTFILATTNLEKVPATIISRCQVIEFKNFTESDIAENLLRISSIENLKLHENAARLIARRAAGGMRDALSYLEQVASYTLNGIITVESVEKALGLLPSEIVDRYIDYLLNGNFIQIDELIDRIFIDGYDVYQLVQSAIEKIEERISQKPSERLLKVAQGLIEISKELRFVENKKVICKILSMNLAATNQKTLEQTAPQIEQIIVPTEQTHESRDRRPDDKSQPEQSLQIEEILNWIKEEKDLSIYVALVQSRISQKNNTVEISFLPSQRFQYEYLREKILELEYLFKTKAKKDIVINIFIDEEREKRILQKLQENFPGKIRIEE